MRATLTTLTCSLVLVAAAGVAAGPANAQTSQGSSPTGRGGHHGATVSVSGTVTTPASYTATELAALPQTTSPDLRAGAAHGRTVTGVSLEALVQSSAPVLPAGKNTQLRVVLAVGGAGHRTVPIALGELDPSFGNHPALLVTTSHGRPLPTGPELVFPGDRGFARTVVAVSSISVSVSTAEAPSPLPVDSVVVQAGGWSRTVTAAQLATLPASTYSVSFLAGTAAQQHTEVGPTLASVLRLARVPAGAGAVVTAVGGDSYGASVTLGEAVAGRRPLVLSLNEDGVPLTEPRLIADGDVKGGRDVSGVVELFVSGGCPRNAQA